MPDGPLDVPGFIRTMLDRGWHWGGADADLLIHPTNYDFYLRYDALTGHLTVSPALDAHLSLIIPTPASKGRFWR
jgi:hypothetical protein